MVNDLIDELALLQAGRVVNATLQDAAAMTMGTDRHAVSADGIEYELGIL